MRNTLGDLHNILFEQIERLNSDDLEGAALIEEIARSKAITNVANTMVDNASLVLEAEKFKDDKGNIDAVIPKMLEG